MTNRIGSPKKPWRMFFYGGELHKTLTLHRAADELIAWNYIQHKKMMYSWTDVKLRGSTAYLMREVTKMTGRSKWCIYNWIYKGWLPRPQRAYSLKTGNPGWHYFSQNDIMNIFEVIKSTHQGRPRQDGVIVNYNVPNERELKAAVTRNLFVYAQNMNGDYVPIWEAESQQF